VLRNPSTPVNQVWNRRARKTAGNRYPRPCAVRNLRPSNVGEPLTSLLLLQLPAVPPAVGEHPGGPPTERLPRRPVLHEAVVVFLSTALFGPERQAYWRRRLADSRREEEAAPAHVRLEELRAEITDLERRIERQVANLEAEDATPSLRRRVGARIAELEGAVEDGGSTRTRSPPKRPTPRRRSQTSPPRSTACRFSLSGFRTCPRRNSGRCSTACSCRSPSSRRRVRSTLRSRSSRTSRQTCDAWCGSDSGCV
jgi:hypothetical protein